MKSHLNTNRSVLLFLVACFAMTFLMSTASASIVGDATVSINWWEMMMKLLGGLAIFLFGMEQMADALKAAAGDRMKTILAKLTTNRFMGAVTGSFVTAIIQSSSVTTVLVVGFISAGLMSMSQSVGVIMGANVGTTITAQIVAFKVTKLALLMIAVGFSMLFFSKQQKIKQYGNMLMGLGMVFFGMSVMSDAMKPLRTFEPFLELMTKMENPLFGILIAAAFTGLVQSSSATTGIVIVMASQGFITLPAGIALAFGANIGTCITAMLASIGKPREAVRAAVVHILFNVLGVLLWIFFIDYLAEAVLLISPTHPELEGLERLGAETPRQIANAHTIFNVANTLIFIGFTTQFARLVEKLVPDRPMEEISIIRPRYLDDSIVDTPSLALDRARLEAHRMGDRVEQMVGRILPAIFKGDHEELVQVTKLDDEVDILHGEIINFLGRLSQSKLTDENTKELVELISAVNDMENIGDIVEVDLVALGEKRIDKQARFSESTRKALNELADEILYSIKTVNIAMMQKNEREAQNVIAMKSKVNRLVDRASLQLVEHLTNDARQVETYAIEMDILEKFKRIYYFSKRIAKTVVPAEIDTNK